MGVETVVGLSVVLFLLYLTVGVPELPPPPAARHAGTRAMLCTVALAATAAPIHHQQFAVVFDGGSTGTRVYVYRYALPSPGASPALPTLYAERGWNMKVTAGALH